MLSKTLKPQSRRSVRLFDRTIVGDLARLRLVSKFSTTCYCGHTLRLLVRQVVQLVVRFHRVIAREVTGSRMTSRRSLRLIILPIADRHDWLYDQSQTAMTGCTTNRRSPWLVARPIADRHDWLHDQSQIATTGCTTNRRLPRLSGVARPPLRVARPVLACPLQEEPGGYLHVHSLVLQQPLLLHLDVTSSPFHYLSWAAFLQHFSVTKLKEYWY